jgi:hypothetical protein
MEKIKNQILILVFSIVFMFSCFSVFTNWQFVQKATHTNGIVTALNAGDSHPQIEYSLPTSKQISYAQGGLIFGYKVGDSVNVLFFSEGKLNRRESINTFGAIYGFAVLGGVGSLIVMLILLKRITQNT